jgi:hypothetical protein
MEQLFFVSWHKHPQAILYYQGTILRKLEFFWTQIAAYVID